MPRSVEWYKKYSPNGFILLGFHSAKKETKEEVIAFCKAAKMTFPVYEGGNVAGVAVTGVPHFILFDHTGKMIYSGNMGEVDGKLADAMKNAPDPLIGAGPFKKLSALAKKIVDRKELGKIMTTLKTKHLNSEDADEKAEAENLVEHLNRYGNKLLKKAGEKKATEPTNCYNLYQQAATLFKGDEIGNNAEQIVKELKADKEFQDNIKADKELASIQAEIETFKPCSKCYAFNKNCEPCQKKNASFESVKQRTAGLLKKYPNSPAAGKAKDLMPPK
ncbi:MAG: hypothetical protein V1701_06560 [Planctomycetota bacterium]